MIKYHDDDKFEALQQAKCLRTFLPLGMFRSFQFIKWSGRGLQKVLPKLQWLRMLKLSGSDIEELSDSVNNLKHLRHMDMSDSRIKKLPDTICTLYNLQALLLVDCDELTELPPNFGRLIKLAHVDVEGTKLIKMPPHMGNLKDLQVLTAFVLDKHTAWDNLLELKKLQNLHGKLEISGLVHGSGLEAYILRDKKFLNELILNWGYYGHVGEEGNALEEREVLEKLQPNPDLERLTIDGYGGEMFPGWLRYYSSPALVYLKLSQCANCKSLPPLGQLPSLRKLHISDLHGVVSIGHEFYYSDDNTFANKPFRSLQSLTLKWMSGWEEWSHEGGLFPNLSKLHLSQCPQLKGRLALDSFPMLKKVVLWSIGFSHLTSSQECPELVRLELFDCPNLVSFPDGGLPNLTDIEIRDCDKLGSWPAQMHTLLPSLQSLSVRHCPELESFPEGELPAQLKSLHIENCKKFNADSLQECPELVRLELFDCPNLVSFPDGGLQNLTDIEIRDCDKLGSWPAQMHTLLPSLQSLSVRHCPELESFPEGGLPAQLKSLYIDDCKKFNANSLQNLNKGLRSLTSLEELTLNLNGCEEVDSFPEETLLPSTLTHLHIYCLKLKTMDGDKWFGHHNSLETLEFTYCELQCLPDTGLPASLRFLGIYQCTRLLERRCEREKGEDWPKIAHIDVVHINAIIENDDTYGIETDDTDDTDGRGT